MMTPQPRPLTSDLLDGLPHGFFTRDGGVSAGIHQGLNCGPGSQDDPSAVEINRQRAAAALGAETLLTLNQVHSDIALEADPGWQDRPQADALVTDKPGTVIGVLSADCAPVLFADRQAGVIGAAHAGWKGAFGGIVEATLDRMERLGADRARVAAAVGPCISQRAYEVGPEFFETFTDEDPAWHRFFVPGEGDRLLFDLPGFVLHRLRYAGVAEAEWIGRCTYSEPERFFSYRRATHAQEPDYGRLLSAIRL